MNGPAPAANARVPDKAVRPDEAIDAGRTYEVKQWRYEPTKEYGGEKKDVETLAVRSATPSADGTRVSLVVPGLRAGRTVAIRTDPVSASGEPAPDDPRPEMRSRMASR